MKRKVFVFSLVAMLLAGCVAPVYALEVTDNGDCEVGVSTDLVDPPDGMDDVETGADDGGTTSGEAGSGVDGGSGEGGTEEPVIVEPSMVTLDGATVNVSPESVQAIADAVSDSGFSVTNKLGQTFEIPDDALAFWDNYSHHYIFNSGGNRMMIFCDGVFKRNSEGSTSFYTGRAAIGQYRSDGSIVIAMAERGSHLTNVSGVTYVVNTLYADSNILDFDDSIIYESDVSLSYTITFNTGFDDLSIDSQKTSNLSLPVISYDGYKFDGWYLDEEHTLPVTSDTTWVQDTTIYAKWIPFRTVTFVTGIDGYELDSIQLLSGESYTSPAFSYAGYELVGVYTDENFVNQFVGGTVVTEDLTLYLRFEPIVYDMGALLTQQVELSKGLQVMQSQMWVILSVGLLYFVYRFFRLFF